MKLNFPKIVRPVDLGEYAETWGGQSVFVWVNPPSKDLVDIGDLYKQSQEKDGDKAGEKYLALFSSFLSQGEPDTHFNVEDLENIEKATKETDPAFWMWLQTRVIVEISEHRLGRKKA